MPLTLLFIRNICKLILSANVVNRWSSSKPCISWYSIDHASGVSLPLLVLLDIATSSALLLRLAALSRRTPSPRSRSLKDLQASQSAVMQEQRMYCLHGVGKSAESSVVGRQQSRRSRCFY